MSTLTSASGRIAPVCHQCHKRGPYTTPTPGGRVDLWELRSGWQVAPFPDDHVHADGSTGDLYTCPDCRGSRNAPSSISRPAWAAPELDDHDDPALADQAHPDDLGTWFRSRPVDEWTVVEHERGRTFTGESPARVYVDGFRHHNGRHLDWPDQIRVRGDLNPSGNDGTLLPETARRLAAALLAAADLIEGGQS